MMAAAAVAFPPPLPPRTEKMPRPVTTAPPRPPRTERMPRLASTAPPRLPRTERMPPTSTEEVPPPSTPAQEEVSPLPREEEEADWGVWAFWIGIGAIGIGGVSVSLHCNIF